MSPPDHATFLGPLGKPASQKSGAPDWWPPRLGTKKKGEMPMHPGGLHRGPTCGSLPCCVHVPHTVRDVLRSSRSPCPTPSTPLRSLPPRSRGRCAVLPVAVSAYRLHYSDSECAADRTSQPRMSVSHVQSKKFQ